MRGRVFGVENIWGGGRKEAGGGRRVGWITYFRYFLMLRILFFFNV